MPATFYFAWVNEGVTFSAGTHATIAQKVFDGSEGGAESEDILSFAIEHNEGEFATLTIEVLNPEVGLLAEGRNQWCLFSVDTGSGPELLLNGRLYGAPKKLDGPVMQLQFIAGPNDYLTQKATLADTLRVLPWFDPVWIEKDVEDDDAVLEARAEDWHIDRKTLTVTTSNILSGEDGTLELGPDDHFYDGFDAGYSDAPTRKVNIKATISWPQEGEGDVDLTYSIGRACKDAGSPWGTGIIGSLTGDGLVSAWPKPGDSIGDGWTVADGTFAKLAWWFKRYGLSVKYIGTPEGDPSLLQDPQRNHAEISVQGWVPWIQTFFLMPIQQAFIAHYTAERQRTETIIATLEADVQPVVLDATSSDEVSLELNSDFVGQEVDASDVSPAPPPLPIDDVRRNSYFKTDRGQQSWENVLLQARAKLMAGSRVVEVTCLTTFENGVDLSCRKNVHIVDSRLPGGNATGKVTSYTVSANGDDGTFETEIKIGCAVGYGAALSSAAAGTGVYANPGYMNPGYQKMLGAEVALVPGELKYQSFDDFDIDDDDGLNLFDMRARNIVDSITVADGVGAQKLLLNPPKTLGPPSLTNDAEEPGAILADHPTQITLNLKPVVGGPFNVEYDPTVSLLVIPLGIDLEASP